MYGLLPAGWTKGPADSGPAITQQVVACSLRLGFVRGCDLGPISCQVPCAGWEGVGPRNILSIKGSGADLNTCRRAGLLLLDLASASMQPEALLARTTHAPVSPAMLAVLYIVSAPLPLPLALVSRQELLCAHGR